MAKRSLNWQTVLALGATGLVVYEWLKGDLESVGDAVNPTNPNNVFARSADAVGQAVTGDDSWSIGGAIYNATHDDAPNCFTVIRSPDGQDRRARWHACGTRLPESRVPDGWTRQ